MVKFNLYKTTNILFRLNALRRLRKQFESRREAQRDKEIGVQGRRERERVLIR